MSTDINRLLDFVSFTHEFRKIKRVILLEGEGEYENDAEHSFQTAIVALYIIDSNNLKLDKYKCMALALVHDIIEVYSGDTNVFSSKKELASKEVRERKAIEQLKVDWPDIPTVHSLIKEYKDRKTPESKFVYALDKLITELNNYTFEGRIWQELGITFEQVKTIKKGKVDVDETIKSYHQKIMSLIEQRPELFGKKRVNYG